VKLNDYYFIEIIKCRKDNPKMTVDSKLIRAYYAYSIEEFDEIKDDILCTCEVNMARAYIKLNVRNAEMTTLTAMKKLVTIIIDKNYRYTTDLFRKISRDSHAESNVKFLINTNTHNDYEFAKSVIDELWSKTNDLNDRIRIITEIPTPNGIHIITITFDIDAFKQNCPNIEVYRDGSAVLYSPIFEKGSIA
jgi:hypothetical protein